MQVNDSGGKHGGLDRTGASEGSLISPIALAAAASRACSSNRAPYSRTAAITVARPTPNTRAAAATA